MKKITINPHHCSREEYQELIEYLENNHWDFDVEPDEKEINYALVGCDEIRVLTSSNRPIKINEKIFDEELFDYRIVSRKDLLEDLMRWISECRNSDKELMKQDLQMLMQLEDEYIFSSISTNDYISSEDSNFNETCKELLELNETLK